MTGFVKIEVKDLGESHEFSAETELHHVSDVDKAMILNTMIDALDIDDEDIATMFLTVAMVRNSKKEEA